MMKTSGKGRALIFSAVALGSVTGSASSWNPMSLVRKAEKEIQKIHISSTVNLERFETDRYSLSRVENIANRLIAAMPEHEAQMMRQVDIRVIDTYREGGVAVAQESIYLFSGLVGRLSDDELAFVIAHEMGHVAKDHLHNFSVNSVYIPLTIALITFWTTGYASYLWNLPRSDKIIHSIKMYPINALISGLLMGHAFWQSRKNEFEADKFGIDALVAAGFDAEKAMGFFDKIPDHTYLTYHVDASEWLGWLKIRVGEITSTHPSNHQRRGALAATLTSKHVRAE